LHAEVSFHGHAGGFERIVDLAHLARMFENESDVEIRRICGRRRVEQVADGELEARVVLENRDLFLPLIAAAQTKNRSKNVRAASTSDTCRSRWLSLMQFRSCGGRP
jgi:hypothetical protein